jgi:hypothetical protein
MLICEQQRRVGAFVFRALVKCSTRECYARVVSMNMMDTLAAQQEIDIFNAVKRIRIARPEFIPSVVFELFVVDNLELALATVCLYICRLPCSELVVYSDDLDDVQCTWTFDCDKHSL